MAYVYCIISINAISYACNATVFVYVYFTVDGSSIAEQFYGCTLTVSQFCYHAAHCTQSQCCTAIADGFDIFQVFIQFNAYSSTVIAYADVLIAAKVNSFAGFYIGCFGCYTVSRQIPAFISVSGSFFYFLQLAYVYSIIIINACCYAADFAVLVEGNLAVDYGVTILHVNRCAFTVNNACSACCTIQCQLSIAVGNGGNISQIACNINLVIGLAVFNCSFNCCILAIRQCSMFTCFCFYIFQLAYVYCVSISNTCCYAADFALFVNSNLTIDRGQTANHEYRCSNAVLHACPAFSEYQLTGVIADGLNTLQILVQLNSVISYVVVLSFCSYCYIAVTAYGCTVCIYGINHMSVICGSLVYLSNVSATFNLSFSCGCCCADVFQLAIVYSISIGSTCCYAADFAVFIYGNLLVDYGSAALHVNRCALAVDNTCSACCTIQCQLSIAVGNGGNISQIACNINLVIGLAIFNCRCNCCILAVRQGGMLKCFCFYIVQLAYVYSVFIRTTGSYTANGAILSYFYFTINFSTATHKAYRCLTVS